MIKPRQGAGGWRNQIVQSKEEKEKWIKKFPELPSITQNVVTGIPTSVSCLSDGKRAITIAMNEQLLQNTPIAPFGFAGSITPIIHPLTNEMQCKAAVAAASSGCIGSFGIDFVLGDQAWAIEVNPRFQATIDTVEMATSCNIFKLHIDAFYGHVPKKRSTYKSICSTKNSFCE
jgi:predicted ATP-grasp superfamily ATP-dependent carboligase